MVEKNEAVEDGPALINQSPELDGWLYKYVQNHILNIYADRYVDVVVGPRVWLCTRWPQDVYGSKYSLFTGDDSFPP